jgi:hypothetical protein
MVPVEMSDEHIRKIFWGRIGLPEAVNVVMGDEPTVEMQELIELLVHQRHVTTFDNLPKLPHNGKIANICFP